MRLGLLLALLCGLAPAAEALTGPAPPRCLRGSQSNPAVFSASAIRAIVVEGHERDGDVFEAARAIGANTIVTHANPDAQTAALAHGHGLFYIGWMSVGDLARTEVDPAYAAKVASVHPLAAIYYEDDAAAEGYASAAAQERATRRAGVSFRAP